jgi:DNA repair exonuclease SbcCD ATPase subunit
MEARLKRLNGLVGVCPTCEQRIAGGDKASLVRRVSVEQQALLKALTRARELSSEAKKVVDRLPLSPPPPDTTAVSDASQQYADAGTRLTSAKREEERLRHAMETLTQARAGADEKVRMCEDAIDTVSTELGELGGKIEQADAWVACYEFWAEGFGNRGLKSLLIEAALPEINQAATMYARRLIPGARLRLSATTALKTRDAVKEALSLEVHLPRFTRTYGGASKGQRTRLLLSLLLALRDVVSRRAASPFDQFFADELFDGLDRTGSECVAELLGEIAARCPVVLITHDDRLKGEGGRTLTVLHDGREASILSGGKARSAGS